MQSQIYFTLTNILELASDNDGPLKLTNITLVYYPGTLASFSTRQPITFTVWCAN